MKKNRTMRIATLMLALTLITCCFVGSTFAKYTSSTSGDSTARVALWDIGVNEGSGEFEISGTAETMTFDLFDAYTDTGVLDHSTDNLIAPGTQSSVSFDIINNSEVKAQTTVTLTEANTNNVFLQYRLSESDEWVDSIDALDGNDDGQCVITDVLTFIDEDDQTANDKTTITLYWRWAFDNTDSATVKGHDGQTNDADTALGVAGNATVTINASILVEQVDN